MAILLAISRSGRRGMQNLEAKWPLSELTEATLNMLYYQSARLDRARFSQIYLRSNINLFKVF